MNNNAKIVEKEMQDEMIGVLTAMSIVARRLARRLSELENQKSDPQQERKVKS